MPDQPAPASHPTQTPVLFLIHRRLDVTARVFAAIRQARPTTLLIAADGPAEDAQCQQCREMVLDQIDWPCTVETRFLEQRVGCKRAVSGALDWAFSNHERVIVIEDDCLPSSSFFRFCDELLERYADTPEVVQICGSNLTGYSPQDGTSYFCSRYGPIWGWASWRRVWQHYDVDMKSWPEVRQNNRLHALCLHPFEKLWRQEMFDESYAQRIDTWDYQWGYARLLTGGVNIVPAVNLISNLGFGPDATHTFKADDPRSAMVTGQLNFPLQHPASLKADETADPLHLRLNGHLPASYFSPAAARWLLGWGKRRLKEWLASRHQAAEKQPS